MTSNSTKSSSLQSEGETAVRLLDDWFDPIEAGLRDRVREFIQAMIESELEAALVRPRYGRRPKADPAMPMARALSPATGTVTDRGR
jgi:putative transposase